MTALKRMAVPIGIAAASLLVYMINPWLKPEKALLPGLTALFWLLSVGLLVVLFAGRREPASSEVELEGPAITRFLFRSRRAGLIWLPIRLFVGFAWLDAGLHKIVDPKWVDGGSALRGYWERAVAIPEQGRPLISFEWYRDFLNVLLAGGHETWFAWLITLGEIAVGVALIVGFTTFLAAFFGAVMNMSFMLAGSASTNPLLFALAIGLVLAWRVSGHYGFDRYLLPIFGTPWSRGSLFRLHAPRPIPG